MSVDDLLQYDPQATYGAIALDYDYAQQHYWSFATDIALELAGLAPGMTVLDAGCGTGVATLRAAERVRPHGRVVAVDFAPEMLALASEKASRRALLNIDWRLKDLTTLELPSASFDVVLCLDALFAIADMPALTAALWALLRPGGRLVVATPGRPYLAPLHDAFYAAAHVEAPDLTPPRPWRRTDTAERLAAVFDAAGIPAALSDRTATQPLREPDDWWRVVRATGLSRTTRLLGPEASARVAAANLRAIDENGIDALTTQFLFAVARK